MLRFFDQLRFFPVTEDELLARRDDIAHGAGGVDIEPTVFRLADHHTFLAENADDIETFRRHRDNAFAAERVRWKESGVAEYVSAVPEPEPVGDEAPLAAGGSTVAGAGAGNGVAHARRTRRHRRGR